MDAGPPCRRGVETRTAGMRGERATGEARVAQLRAAIPERRAAIASVAAERASLAGPLEAARAAHGTAETAHELAEATRATLRSELMALEREHGGVGARLGELERASQAAAIEASRRDEALAGLLREREMALEGLPDAAGAADAGRGGRGARRRGARGGAAPRSPHAFADRLGQSVRGGGASGAGGPAWPR